MGTISDYLEDELLDHLFNAAYSSVGTVYLALGTTVNADVGITGEPSGNGYARQSCAFDAAATRKVQSTALITYGPVSGSNWGTMYTWGVYDALTAGNCLAYGSLDVPKACNVGNTPKVAANEVEVEFVTGAISTAYAHDLLNLAFRNVTGLGLPTTYVALCDETPADGDTDISAKEPSGNGYAREIVNENGGSSPTWDLAGGGTAPNVDNTHLIQFDTPSGSWGTITHVAVCNALTVGQVICWAALDSSEPITTDDDVEIAIGALDINMS